MSDAPSGPPAARATGALVRAAIAKVLADIAPEADLAGLAPDTNLRHELDLDSVDFQNLLAGLSKALGRDIPDRDAGSLTSIAACERFFGR